VEILSWRRGSVTAKIGGQSPLLQRGPRLAHACRSRLRPAIPDARGAAIQRMKTLLAQELRRIDEDLLAGADSFFHLDNLTVCEPQCHFAPFDTTAGFLDGQAIFAGA
jgi:hypothetical protein